MNSVPEKLPPVFVIEYDLYMQSMFSRSLSDNSSPLTTSEIVGNTSGNFVSLFQHASHRVLRWTITPFLLIFVLLINIFIVFETRTIFYELLLAGQSSFYLLAFSGWLMEQKTIRIKALFIPYYFCVMNYAAVQEFFVTCSLNKVK